MTEAEHSGPKLHEENGFFVIDCEACGYAHVHPMPTPEELSAQYTDYPVAPAYLSRTREDLEWWQQLFGWRLRRLQIIGNAGAHRRVLDVGAGLGYFSELASRMGWESVGVEPSRHRCAHARSIGCEIYEGTLDEAIAAGGIGNFDAIHASEVLEHIRDPLSMLISMRNLLRPGGALCVVVPNDFNPIQLIATNRDGIKKWWVSPQHHLNYFNHTSFSRLAIKAGLQVVDITSTFPIDIFLLMGENYIGNDQLGRACHHRRTKLELAVGAFEKMTWYEDLNRAFATLGIGREVVLWAQRPTSE